MLARHWTGQIHYKGCKCTRSGKGGQPTEEIEPQKKWCEGESRRRQPNWLGVSDQWNEVIHISSTLTCGNSLPMSPWNTQREHYTERQSHCSRGLWHGHISNLRKLLLYYGSVQQLINGSWSPHAQPDALHRDISAEIRFHQNETTDILLKLWVLCPAPPKSSNV